MSGNTDKMKGRIKQAIGALTGDEKLKRQGRRDERAGTAKQKMDGAIDAVSDKVAVVVAAPSEKEK